MAEEIVVPEQCYSKNIAGIKVEGCISFFLESNNLFLRLKVPGITEEIFRVAGFDNCYSITGIQFGGLGAYVKVCLSNVSVQLPVSIKIDLNLAACVAFPLIGERCTKLAEFPVDVAQFSDVTLGAAVALPSDEWVSLVPTD